VQIKLTNKTQTDIKVLRGGLGTRTEKEGVKETYLNCAKGRMRLRSKTHKTKRKPNPNQETVRCQRRTLERASRRLFAGMNQPEGANPWQSRKR